MQRRAAAIYFVFFLVVAVGAWAYVGVAEDVHQPEYSVSGTTFENGSTATIDGADYTVNDIVGSEGEFEATLAYTDPDVNQSATLENGSMIDYEGGQYNVSIPNATNVSSFTLEEELNVSALLADDEAVENELAEQNDTEYVVYRENRTLQPLQEWLPEPQTSEFTEGDQIEYENETTTVASVEAGTATLEWQAAEEVESGLTEGGNVTLASGNSYFAHFPGEGSVVLAPQSEYAGYAETTAEREYFNERQAGLWGVTIVSAIAALLILSMAYMPSRG